MPVSSDQEGAHSESPTTSSGFPQEPSNQDLLNGSDLSGSDGQTGSDGLPTIDLEDEPVPSIPYRGDLHQRLHEVLDLSTNIDQVLMVDQFLVDVDDLEDFQRERISNILLSLNRRRRAGLLALRRGEEWTGAKLLLFLEFRIYWSLNYPSLFFYISDEDACEIIDKRMPCSVDEVVPETWAIEWDNLYVENKNPERISTFASFVEWHCQSERDDDWFSIASDQFDDKFN